jgi:hypothetical protein
MNEHIFEMRNPLLDEVGQGENGRKNAQKGMEVRPSQIGIDEDNPGT